MARYLLRRTVQAVFVAWAAFTVSFGILYLLPGDPVAIMAGGTADSSAFTPAQLAALRAQYGLDQSVPEQYLHRLAGALHADFGTSVQTGAPVTSMIAEALPETAKLAGSALVLAVVAGAAIAFTATYSRRQWLRQLLLSVPAVGVSLPTFWVGLLLVQFVSFQWRLLPAVGNNGWQSLVLPAITLALPYAAVLGQVFAKSMRTTLEEPYVQTAQAKGASRGRIHIRHAARNAALPTFTLAGVIFGNLLAGAIVVETVFSRAGVGRLTADAVATQDIPVVQGLVVLGAMVFVLVNLAVDIVYPLLDPRIVAHTAKPVPGGG
jgi:peptide/nickel transport system permease protein